MGGFIWFCHTYKQVNCNFIKTMLNKFLIILSFLPFVSFSQSIQNTYNNLQKHLEIKDFTTSEKIVDTLINLEPSNNNWIINKAEINANLNNIKKTNQLLRQAFNQGYYVYDNYSNENGILYKKLNKTKEYNSLLSDIKTYLHQFKQKENTQTISAKVPEIMECYAIMLYLINPKHTLINTAFQNHPYFKKIDIYFSEHKNNINLIELSKLYPGKFEDWIVNMKAHHNLRSFYFYDKFDTSKIVSLPIEENKIVANLVSQFAKDTNFLKFYDENKEFYDAMSSIILTNYSFGNEIIPFFNKNFNKKINKFNIFFTPIYSGWQHGPSVIIDDYIESFYFGGIMYVESKEFYYPDSYFLFTLISEFDHAPINKISSNYNEKFESLKEKYLLLSNGKNVSYSKLKDATNEYLTWAFALHFFYENKEYDYLLLEKMIIDDMEKYRGFIRFGEFWSFYKEEYINSKKYQNIDQFYPQIISWLSNLK
ncbi:DUF4932 domain-containing protein [Flavobacterium acetivorans]|uniref:DUF4932 domain-containing protein n=1 Tax=Flavobacterium acetivorans TaxID=2893883 RepID=UPI001E4601AD|nr:DUF4932 domain-containing protein [Flavobacterium sp. F-29]UFH34933.1 DUF4932 domain-containing protein [Flavobacterium sp. F-29]